MAELNLDSMSLDELKALQKQVARAIEGYKDREKMKALAALEAKAAELGFSLSELMGGKRGKKTGLPKYRHPENPSVTWTGKGRRPEWVKDALAAGKTLDDLSI